MIEHIVALLMFIGPDIKEHRIQPEGMAQCLRHKRIAQNEVNPERVVFTCKKVKAQTEIYMDRKKIIKIL